ncbi:MAG: response regulator transcription factor [Phycisphaeraceae bacterium JB051]
MKDLQVYLISDQPTRLRDNCLEILQSIGLKVNTCQSVASISDQYQADKACCILAYMRVSDYLGIEIHRTIINQGIGAPVIILSESADVPLAVTAIKQGAFDVLPWPLDTDELKDAILQAIEMDKQRITHEKARDELLNRLGELTKREKQILQLVVNGLSSSQIAYQLVRSEKTVKLHRAHIMKKLRCDSAHELVHRMIKLEFDLNHINEI